MEKENVKSIKTTVALLLVKNTNETRKELLDLGAPTDLIIASVGLTIREFIKTSTNPNHISWLLEAKAGSKDFPSKLTIRKKIFFCKTVNFFLFFLRDKKGMVMIKTAILKRKTFTS